MQPCMALRHCATMHATDTLCNHCATAEAAGKKTSHGTPFEVKECLDMSLPMLYEH